MRTLHFMYKSAALETFCTVGCVFRVTAQERRSVPDTESTPVPKWLLEVSDLDVRHHSSRERQALRARVFLEVNSEEPNHDYRRHRRRWRCWAIEEGVQLCLRPHPLPDWSVCQHTVVGAVRFSADQWNRPRLKRCIDTECDNPDSKP